MDPGLSCTRTVISLRIIEIGGPGTVCPQIERIATILVKFRSKVPTTFNGMVGRCLECLFCGKIYSLTKMLY